MEDICIREFQWEQDFERSVALWKSIEKGVHLGRSDTPEELKKKLQHDPDLFLVAEAEGQLIGTVIGGFDGRRGMVYHLAVQKEFRSRSVGSQLMAELEDRLRAKGCIRCYLMVTLDNPEAAAYYEKHGWSRMEIWPYAKDLV